MFATAKVSFDFTRPIGEIVPGAGTASRFFCVPRPHRRRRLGLALAAILGALGSFAHGIIITMDYSLDSTGFFGTNSAARAAVDAAAADLSAAILPSLGAVNTDSFSGSSGGATATLDWRMTYRNPVTNANISVQNFTLAADSITIYAGMRLLAGSTLGEGGPGGAGVSVGISGPSGQHQAAMNEARRDSNAVMPRDADGLEGPIMGTFSGTIGSASFNVSYGPLAGSLWLDNDTDNNGVPDGASRLDAFWHFDHTAEVASEKNDFYSVALHEIIHSIGFGTADTWNNLTTGTTWTGSAARALNGGSGLNLLAGDGAHIADGYQSFRISDGAPQEVVMDRSLTNGTRKTLTVMDLAFLRDLGYATIPEPSTVALLAFSALAFPRRGRRNRPDRRA